MIIQIKDGLKIQEQDIQLAEMSIGEISDLTGEDAAWKQILYSVYDPATNERVFTDTDDVRNRLHWRSFDSVKDSIDNLYEDFGGDEAKND